MNEKNKKHSFTLTERSMLNVNGVDDLLTFDEELVTLGVGDKTLSVTGSELCVTKLSLETGEVNIKGVIDAMVYSFEEQKKPLFSRIFG